MRFRPQGRLPRPYGALLVLGSSEELQKPPRFHRKMMKKAPSPHLAASGFTSLRDGKPQLFFFHTSRTDAWRHMGSAMKLEAHSGLLPCNPKPRLGRGCYG